MQPLLYIIRWWAYVPLHVYNAFNKVFWVDIMCSGANQYYCVLRAIQLMTTDSWFSNVNTRTTTSVTWFMYSFSHRVLLCFTLSITLYHTEYYSVSHWVLLCITLSVSLYHTEYYSVSHWVLLCITLSVSLYHTEYYSVLPRIKLVL